MIRSTPDSKTIKLLGKEQSVTSLVKETNQYHTQSQRQRQRQRQRWKEVQKLKLFILVERQGEGRDS
jgi:hypothetical protein